MLKLVYICRSYLTNRVYLFLKYCVHVYVMKSKCQYSAVAVCWYFGSLTVLKFIWICCHMLSMSFGMRQAILPYPVWYNIEKWLWLIFVRRTTRLVDIGSKYRFFIADIFKYQHQCYRYFWRQIWQCTDVKVSKFQALKVAAIFWLESSILWSNIFRHTEK